jgi:arylsulfatase A-like enzyme
MNWESAPGHISQSAPYYHCHNCSVLLITVDTLRADHVGCYGYEYNTTPFIDELAGEGIVFEQAIASAPITLSSHTSILTSLYPFQHGVLDNGGYVVRESVVSLPELLRERGFTTAAFVSTFVLDSFFGLDQGFKVYDDEMTLPKDIFWEYLWFNWTNISNFERKADEVSDSFLNWLSDNHDTRFFVWLHYFDPHSFYSPPDSYLRLFKSRNNKYDGEIRFTDDQIRRVIGEMDDMGLLEDTLVVIVADHGEGLGDHGESIHGSYLYDTTVWVPLIVVNPRHEGGLRVPELVETIDVAPTILQILGYEKPDYMQGRNLYDLMEEGGKELAYSETFYRTRKPKWEGDYWLCLRSPEFKYIYNNAGGDMLYNLTNDPGEDKNLFRRGKNSTYYKGILDDFMSTTAN